MNIHHVWLLSSTELTRRYRSIRTDTRRFVVLIISALLLLLPIGAMLIGLYALGGLVRTDSLPVSMAVVRGIGGSLVFVVAILNAIRTVQTAAVPENADGVLTLAAHDDVVVSLVLVETIAGAGVVLVPLLLGAVAVGLGTGSVLAVMSFAGAAVGAIVVGSLLGIGLGFVVRIALARSQTLSKYRTPVAIVLFLGYFYAIATLEFGSAFEPIAYGVGNTPIGWYADLALLPVLLESNSTYAGGAIALTVFGGVGLTLAIDRLAALLWYDEAVEGTSGVTASSGIGGVAGIPRSQGRIIRKNWLRAWRSPIRLIFVAYPLFFAFAPVSEWVQTGSVPPFLAGLIAMYGAWACGAAFTLNPLGDEGDVLPVTLTSPVDGRTFIGGCCLSGILIGLPVTVFGVFVAAIIAGSSPGGTVGAVLLALTLPIAATGIAAGVGVTFPRFEPVHVTRGRKAIIPSLFGFAVYSVVLLFGAAPGVAVQVAFLRDEVGSAIQLSSSQVFGVGLGTTVVLSMVFGAIGYAHAVRRFDAYDMG